MKESGKIKEIKKKKKEREIIEMRVTKEQMNKEKKI